MRLEYRIMQNLSQRYKHPETQMLSVILDWFPITNLWKVPEQAWQILQGMGLMEH
jgi:hypothetical protein